MKVLCSKTNELMTFSQDELLARAFRLGVKDVILLHEYKNDFTKGLITKLKEEKYYTTSFINFSQNTPPSRNVVSREGMNANPMILPVLIY